jgi:poly-gamma-glutamate synthesis protein (capsule biosynthesis protein)
MNIFRGVSARILLTAAMSVCLGMSAFAKEETYDLKLRMVGDDLIHKPILNQSWRENGSYDFSHLFENVKEDIEMADIAVINQETIMIHDYSKASSYPAFGTPDCIGANLVDAGFDVIAHATNHAMDKGEEGIIDTVRYWKENYPEMTYLGIHDSAQDSDVKYVEKNGIRVGFVNYTYGLNGISRPKSYLVDLLSDGDIQNTMNVSRETSDFLVAVLHVGEEYTNVPTDYARKQCARMIDLGADLVLCAHPHVLEPCEMVQTAAGNQGLVYYSLGNFVSWQESMNCLLGGMADVDIQKTVYDDGSSQTEIVGYDLIPLVTQLESGNITTYRLDHYTDELASRHIMADRGWSVEAVKELFWNITGMKVKDPEA